MVVMDEMFDEILSFLIACLEKQWGWCRVVECMCHLCEVCLMEVVHRGGFSSTSLFDLIVIGYSNGRGTRSLDWISIKIVVFIFLFTLWRPVT